MSTEAEELERVRNNKCPVCQSTKVHYHKPELTDYEVYSWQSCEICNAEWAHIYESIRLTVTCQGKMAKEGG